MTTEEYVIHDFNRDPNTHNVLEELFKILDEDRAELIRGGVTEPKLTSRLIDVIEAIFAHHPKIAHMTYVIEYISEDNIQMGFMSCEDRDLVIELVNKI